MKAKKRAQSLYFMSGVDIGMSNSISKLAQDVGPDHDVLFVELDRVQPGGLAKLGVTSSSIIARFNHCLVRRCFPSNTRNSCCC